MVTQKSKADRFLALHNGLGAFVIPNAWDVGSARILMGLGFEALATSSAAAASALGRRDHALSRDEMLAHARALVEATDLPISADLGKGFGDAPEVVAETIRLAADVGLVGCTIEDSTGEEDRPLYDFQLAVDRIAAAAEAAHALPFRATKAHAAFGHPHDDEHLRRCGHERNGSITLESCGVGLESVSLTDCGGDCGLPKPLKEWLLR